MELIWMMFKAMAIVISVIFIVLFGISICLFAGTILTNLVSFSLGGIGLSLRIPLTVLFSVASGYIFLSLLLGSEGYFESDSDTFIHRGTSLGDADEIRNGRPSSRNSRHSRSSLSKTLRENESDDKWGEVFLALLNPASWLPGGELFGGANDRRRRNKQRRK